MAVFAIPNPKKSTQVDFPIDRVKLSVQNISLVNNKYKFTSSNEIFNQYTFEALEFLSLGVFIDINLNSLGENKTEITVEIRRKIGTFNQSYEVTKANEHLVKIFDCIAKLTIKSPEEIEELKNALKILPTKQLSSAKSEQNIPSNAWYEKSWLAILLCVLFFPVGLYALWKNSTIKKGWKVAITVIIALIVIGNIGDKGKSNSSSSSNSSNESTIANPVLTQTQKDSIKAIEDSIVKADAIAKKKWENSKAGKIQKKHTNWSEEDCERVANNRIWIGMSIDMLKYERGTPNNANPSNYGNGRQWQWCWDDYSPSCFYGGDDGIITSYN